MKKAILTGLLLLVACGPKTADTTGSNPQLQLVTQALTPICEQTLKDQKIMPEDAAKFGVTEKAVCECGLSKTEGKLTSDPARIIKIISSEDEQVKFLTEVGSECAVELVKKAVSDAVGNFGSPSKT